MLESTKPRLLRPCDPELLLEDAVLQRAIFESTSFASIATDVNGVIRAFGTGAERALGYAAADVLNEVTPADLADPHEVIARAQALSLELGVPITPGFEALSARASRGLADTYELTYLRKDVSRSPAIVSVTALRDDEGAIIGYLLVGTDNATRKQLEAERATLDQRLRDQQFYTRSLIEANIDALLTTDPSGIITDVNEQTEALTGRMRDELIGTPLSSYFTDPARAEAGIRLALRHEHISNYELTLLHRDGKQRSISYNGTTFYDRQRRLQGVFAAARDITELERLDAGAREQASVAKSDFLSSMSHELRSPLNAILGFAQLMGSDTPLPSPRQQASIDQILRAGWYLLELINDILDLATVDSGRASIAQEPVMLAEVMLECRDMIDSMAARRGITLVIPRLDEDLFVLADRTRLKQIIVNLLSNAIKYNRPNGTVVVGCIPNVAGRTRVTVSDTGLGLPPERLAQLFQLFNRLGQEHGAEEGTGIGLVMSKRIVEMMGGTIGATSTVGEGSCFWFELGSAPSPQLATHAARPSAAPQGPGVHDDELHTLLYVEHNPANLMLIEQIVARRPNLRLLGAGTGALGIEIARTRVPEVILMDINLPDMSGLAALERLCADPVTAHIPVLAISARALPREVESGLEAGFFRYLTKPLDVAGFLRELDAALALALVRRSARVVAQAPERAAP